MLKAPVRSVEAMRLPPLDLVGFGLSIATLIVVGCTLFSLDATAQPNLPSDQTIDVSRWKTFANKAGWAIKYPRDWQVGSCRQCADPMIPTFS